MLLLFSDNKMAHNTGRDFLNDFILGTTVLFVIAVISIVFLVGYLAVKGISSPWAGNAAMASLWLSFFIGFCFAAFRFYATIKRQ